MASLKAPDFTLEALRNGLKGVVFTAKSPSGHHFNVKAPMTWKQNGNTGLLPLLSRPDKIEFQSDSLDSAELSFELFLCDDGETFCERHLLLASWDASNFSLKNVRPGTLEPSQGPSSQKESLSQSHGFLVNRPKEALKRAKSEKKPLLIDFFGIWCPPCNELDEQVFSSNDFAAAAAGIVLLKLDADSPISWELKSKYQVGGYPTLILATPDGDEIDRIVGFRPLTDVKALLGRVAEKPKKTPERVEFHIDKIAHIGNGPQAKDALEAAIAELPESPQSLEWRTELSSLISKTDSAKGSMLRAEAISVAGELIAHPEKLAGGDWTPADLLSFIAVTHEESGEAEKAKAAWAETAREYRKRISSETDRGDSLELAYCLWKSGDFDAAEDVYKPLVKRFPNEFTFHFQRARMNLERSKLDDALVQAKEAHAHSYGDNRLRTAHLMAKILKAGGSDTEAQDLVETTLAQAELPADPANRTHRYVKQLKDLAASWK